MHVLECFVWLHNFCDCTIYDILLTYYDVSVTFILDHPVYKHNIPVAKIFANLTSSWGAHKCCLMNNVTYFNLTRLLDDCIWKHSLRKYDYKFWLAMSYKCDLTYFLARFSHGLWFYGIWLVLKIWMKSWRVKWPTNVANLVQWTGVIIYQEKQSEEENAEVIVKLFVEFSHQSGMDFISNILYKYWLLWRWIRGYRSLPKETYWPSFFFTSFSGVTYNHIFTNTKSQYLFYYILPVKPLYIGSFIFLSINTIQS